MGTKKKSSKKRAAPKAGASRSAAPRAAGVPGVPGPITGVPMTQVGTVVQDFVAFDGVRELTVRREPAGTFTVTPVA